MRKHTILLLCLLLLWLNPPPVAAQWEANPPELIWARDLNGNGARDSLFRTCSFGSGYGGCQYLLKNGGNGPDLELSSEGCFCSYMSWYTFPSEYEKPANRIHFEAIRKEICPVRKYRPDPALSWIQRAAQNTRRSKYFANVLDFGIDWQEGTFRHPEDYWIRLQGPEMDSIFYPMDLPANFDRKEGHAWLHFAGTAISLPRFSLAPLEGGPDPYRKISLGSDQLLVFPHGIALQRKNDWAWLFINVYEVTGGPEKLRWPSMAKIHLRDGLIFLEHSHTPMAFDMVWVIDPQKGTAGLLPVMVHNEGVRFQGNTVILNEHSHGDNWSAPRATYRLSEIKAELAKPDHP